MLFFDTGLQFSALEVVTYSLLNILFITPMTAGEAEQVFVNCRENQDMPAQLVRNASVQLYEER